MVDIRNSFPLKMIVLGASLIMCGVLLIFGIKGTRQSQKRLRECTESAEAVVTHIEKFRGTDDGPNDYTYQYTVQFKDASGKPYEFTTRRTTVELKEGDTTTVHYAPGDMSLTYTDAAPPTKGRMYFFAAGAMVLFGVINMFVFRRR